MSEPTLEDVVVHLTDLMKEVRRQGRAAVAAQAASESCLDAIRAYSERREEREEETSVEVTAAIRWVRALIPVVDAVDRAAAQATWLSAPRPRSKRSWFRALLQGKEDDNDQRPFALAEGLRILHDQLQAALDDLGVTIDRCTGGPVDPQRHRVVEVRPAKAGEQPGIVTEVVRPGYAVGTRVVRETEVVATGEARLNLFGEAG